MPEDATPLTQEALLAGAASKADHLAELSEEMIRQIKLTGVARWYFVVMTALILAVCSALTWIALSNRSINHTVQENTNRIIDCTTAGHDCYDNGQKSTGQAVQQLVVAGLASDWCVAHTKTYADAQKCVIRLTKPA